jgi:hypothetical protein
MMREAAMRRQGRPAAQCGLSADLTAAASKPQSGWPSPGSQARPQTQGGNPGHHYRL